MASPTHRGQKRTGQPGRASLHYERRAAALLAADEWNSNTLAGYGVFISGLMWSAAPTPDQLGLSAVSSLKSIAAVSRLQEQ